MGIRCIIILCVVFLTCTDCLSAQVRSPAKSVSGRPSIFKLSPFERAVLCIKYFEDWHDTRHYPYVGWGHLLQPGERYSARTMTRRQADALLRSDLRKFCAMFRKFGADSLWLGVLAYNVGPAKLLGGKHYPKSRLIRKLERGDRNIYWEYLSFCHYKGKVLKSLKRRREIELRLISIP